VRKLRTIKPVFTLRHTIRLTGPRPFEVNFLPSKTTVISMGRRGQGWARNRFAALTNKKPAG
jgi:hypothetical protein